MRRLCQRLAIWRRRSERTVWIRSFIHQWLYQHAPSRLVRMRYVIIWALWLCAHIGVVVAMNQLLSRALFGPPDYEAQQTLILQFIEIGTAMLLVVISVLLSIPVFIGAYRFIEQPVLHRLIERVSRPLHPQRSRFPALRTCAYCKYDVREISGPLCPECGAKVMLKRMPAGFRKAFGLD